jgi:hypothetical protein
MSRCDSADSPALVRVAGLEQRGSENEGIRKIALEHRLARLQQRDHVLVLSGLQVAVGEDEICGLCVGVRRQHALQLRDRFVRARRLVVGQREVHADLRVLGIELQRRSVLLYGVVELPELGVGGTEVRQRVGAVRADGERGLVSIDGAEQIAGFLQFHRPREQAIEVSTALSRRSIRGRGQKQSQRKNRPLHGHSILAEKTQKAGPFGPGLLF